ncbi:hypothetical protein CBR_g39458 [Chara braunii]|uniref:Right handed beta helix domain-containing protein n=1 Tax=Chara braunii TaxID=69332 RepID=A0A388LRP4_CHABU|nr:hypothetical protein CBR_g39458 [Chara braunii]|eukprot:GBG84994.1 hypothetical protein CBR_g39458 [Chara braunii]
MRQQRLRPVLLLIGLLSFLVPHSPGYGGGAMAPFARIVPSAAAAAPTTPEARLRDAVTKRVTTVLRLTSDLRLTADLPAVTCPNLTVTGNCRTVKGRSRRCKIDGRKRFAGFFFMREGNLTLSNLEVTGFASKSGKDNLFVRSVGGAITVRNCLFTKNSGGVIDVTTGYGLKVEGSSFVRNEGGVINVAYSTMEAKDVLFQANTGVTAIGLVRTGLICRRCVFENNTAQTQAAAVGVGSAGSIRFSRCRFIGNTVTEVGGRGGAVIVQGSYGQFCHCQFERNTIKVAGGKTRIEHVYLNGGLGDFCEKVPSTGVNFDVGEAKVNCKSCPSA